MSRHINSQSRFFLAFFLLFIFASLLWQPWPVNGLAYAAQLTTFTYQGEFRDYRYDPYRWIDGQWLVKVQAKLEMQITVPGNQDQWTRYYSINSVSLLIPFNYATHKKSSPWPPTKLLSESYLGALDNSHFDLSFNLGSATTGTFDHSFLIETNGLPNQGDYSFILFLKCKKKKTFRTPKGGILKIGANGADAGGGFLIPHYKGYPEMFSFWPEVTGFTPPPGYTEVSAANFNDWCNVSEAGVFYHLLRFRDQEHPDRFVKGAVTDGRSQVIVEAPDFKQSATVTFPEGCGRWVGSPYLKNGAWRRVWEAPEDFPDNDPGIGQQTIYFDATVDGESRQVPFRLSKPPVVLLHGLWANGMNTWSGSSKILDQGGLPLVYSPSYDSEASFAKNSGVVPEKVEQALQMVRFQGLVAKKADVVGHSMGGVLAKLNGSSDFIRRVVTIGTPHFGSPFAVKVVSKIPAFLYGTIAQVYKKNLNCGAVKNLGNCNVSGGSLGVPVLAINGISDSTSYPDPGFGMALDFLLKPDSPADMHWKLFRNDTSDWIVSGNSQKGGLSSAYVQDLDVLWHVVEPQTPEVQQAVIDFLNTPTAELPLPPPTEVLPASSLLPEILGPLANTPLEITAPKVHADFAPGDAVRVKVSAPPTTQQVIMLVNGGPGVVAESAPFTATIKIPQQALGEIYLGAISRDANGLTGGAAIPVNVKTTATPKTLRVWPAGIINLGAKKTLQLEVTVGFSDGIEREVTARALGTSYKSGAPTVARISKDGRITGVAEGYSTITVRNGSLSREVPVIISP